MLSGSWTPRTLHRVVLRRFVREDWLAEEPDLAIREAAALELLAGSPVVAPRLVAVDPTGQEAGVPAVLMTRLPGRIEWNPKDMKPFLRRLAEPLPVIHAMPIPRNSPIPAYQPYELVIRRPPSWASQPAMWERAIEIFDGPAPASDPVFVHRDYHPGNVLWLRGRVSGIVDWVAANIGPPEVAVAHCRVNLAYQFGLESADRFLSIYQEITGRTGYHPYWDIVEAMGGMDETIDEHPNPSDEEFLGRAVSELS